MSRARGFNLQEHSQSINGLPAVSVARPGRWGNGYAVWQDDDGRWQVSNGPCHWPVPDKAAGARLAVEKFRADATQNPGVHGGASSLLPLRGKNLACWCAPGSPCHADVLLALANSGPES